MCEKCNLIYHATFIMLYSENRYGKNHFFWLQHNVLSEATALPVNLHLKIGNNPSLPSLCKKSSCCYTIEEMVFIYQEQLYSELLSFWSIQSFESQDQVIRMIEVCRAGASGMTRIERKTDHERQALEETKTSNLEYQDRIIWSI